MSHCISIELSAVQPGDFMMFKFMVEPQHIALVSDKNTIIHAFSSVGKVVENNIDFLWQKRLCGCYRLKEE